MRSPIAFSIFAFLSVAVAVPVNTSTDVIFNGPPGGLPGINWFYTQSECHQAQTKLLQEAFSNAVNLATAPQGISGADASFQEFFGVGWDRPGRSATFYRIFDNYKKAGDFQTFGSPYSNPNQEANQISVHCKDLAGRCGSGYPYRAAYIGHNPSHPGPYMVFCPYFFTKGFPFLADRAKGLPTTSINSLVTNEHIVLHELMHADIAGYQQPIVEVQAVLPGQSDDPQIPGGIQKVNVYGSLRCSLLAAKSSPCLATASNADNYVWLATALYFYDQWQVRPQKRDEPPLAPHVVERQNSANSTVNDGFTYADWEELIDENSIPEDPPVSSAAASTSTIASSTSSDTSATASSTTTSAAATETLSCAISCCGYILDSDWCIANCGGATC